LAFEMIMPGWNTAEISVGLLTTSTALAMPLSVPNEALIAPF
jgi:hypothetical protein